MTGTLPGSPPGSRPRLDLAVVTYNSAADIGGFLDSLDALSDADLRVFVVDNASADDTVERARTHRCQPLVLETGRNLGYAAAINVATRRFDEDALALVVNPDIRLRPGFLEPALRAAAMPGVGIVAPMLTDERGDPLPSLRRDPTVRGAFAEALLGGHLAGRLGLGEVITDPAAGRRSRDVDWAAGALLLITPPCRHAVGDWDESFFLYSEETDYQQRARRAGFAVRYTPDATAFHRGGASHVDPWLWSLLTTNRVRLFRKQHGRGRSLAFWVAVLCNEVLRSPRSTTHRQAARELVRRRRSLLAGADGRPPR